MERRTVLAMLAALPLVGISCGGDDGAGDGGIRVASADSVDSLLASPPDGLVVIDVRTPEEFAEGHLPNADMIDFYAPDFADRIGDLDRDVPYVIYCRSGSRSGQTRQLMEQLGFSDVVDLDGGVLAWSDAGLSLDL